MKIVATSGYADPLHRGHIEYLKMAKDLGDFLIFILNNSKQAELKKGKEFMPLEDRWHVLRSIKYVDEVFISVDQDSTVCKSLSIIRPNIFAKGGDRFAGEIPEKKICDALGIQIIDGLGEKIQSSSSLIKKAKDEYVTVSINGKNIDIFHDTKVLTYEDIGFIAFDKECEGYSVTWSAKPGGINTHGALTKGQKVGVVDNMTINAYFTGNS